MKSGLELEYQKSEQFIHDSMCSHMLIFYEIKNNLFLEKNRQKNWNVPAPK